MLDRDADNDYIEIINTKEIAIDLGGWTLSVGGKSFSFPGGTTIGAYAGWGNASNIIVVAVEKGPDLAVIDPGTGLPLPRPIAVLAFGREMRIASWIILAEMLQEL